VPSVGNINGITSSALLAVLLDRIDMYKDKDKFAEVKNQLENVLAFVQAREDHMPPPKSRVRV
jgi:hypothetical protein